MFCITMEQKSSCDTFFLIYSGSHTFLKGNFSRNKDIHKNFRTFFANFEELTETKFRRFEDILYRLLDNILNNSIRNSVSVTWWLFIFVMLKTSVLYHWISKSKNLVSKAFYTKKIDCLVMLLYRGNDEHTKKQIVLNDSKSFHR